MFFNIEDTNYEEYFYVKKERKQEAIYELDNHGKHYNREITEASIMSFIDWDTFITLRYPYIKNIKTLESVFEKGSFTTHSFKESRQDNSQELVIFSNNHCSHLPIDSVPCSFSNLGNTKCYPRIGVTDGRITSLDKFLFVFYSDVKIVAINYFDLDR